jgi:hypothetical protein
MREAIVADRKPFILTPGIFNRITAAEYHADPVEPAPSLSAGIACELVEHTPFQAWLKHPRLNVEWRERLGLEELSNGVSRFGTVAHELLLGRGRGIHVIQAKTKEGAPVTDYRTKAAQEERDAVIAQGATPCLRCELEQAEDLVDVVQHGIRRIPGCETAFDPDHGQGEITVVWRDAWESWGRCLIDWWSNDGHVYDLKTSNTDLSDEALQRKIDTDNLDLRAAFYIRGISTVRPQLAGRFQYRYVFIQQKPPFELRVAVLDEATLHRGHKKAAYAIRKWAHHLKTGIWPGFPPVIETLSAPLWASNRWESREDSDPVVRRSILQDPYVSAFTTYSAADTHLTEITG